MLQKFWRSYRSSGEPIDVQEIPQNLGDPTKVHEILQKFTRFYRSLGDPTEVQNILQKPRRFYKIL